MSEAAVRKAIDAVFSKYDTDGSETLDQEEL